jgi:penicillin-binding protein 2
MRVGEQRQVLVRRTRVLHRMIMLALLGVLTGYWVVQGVEGRQFRQLAEHNRLRQRPIQAPRGLIVDREGRVLAENVPSYSLLLNRDATSDVGQSLEAAAHLVGRSLEELRHTLERGRDGYGTGRALLAEKLPLPVVAGVELQALEHPEFEVEVDQLRLYRHGEQTAHVLGYLGEASLTDLTERGYSAGDVVGRKGIERQYERVLRGVDGQQVEVVDSRGRTVEEYRREAARAGQEVQLALDLDLQQTARRLLGDRVGVVVAMDPRNGAVRALVSTPAYDPNLFARRLDPERWKELLTAPGDPLQNRAIQNTYAPGSVFKIVMAIAGLQEGVITPDQRVYCSGSVKLYGQRRRCWRAGGHGWVSLERAMRESCDVYFYQLGKELGIDRIAEYARRLGLGEVTGIDLSGEKAGLVPDSTWSLRRRHAPWYPGETVSVAIGQGPILVTPMQVAVLMATVANGGRRPEPRIAAGGPPVLHLVEGVDPQVFDRVRKALWGVVNGHRGTGANARIPGLEVAGKTGTVQVVRQKTWVDSKDLPEEQRDHAWFASFAPAVGAELVVVVLVEHGGKGSVAAAPIARKIYEKYLEKRPDLRHLPAA